MKNLTILIIFLVFSSGCHTFGPQKHHQWKTYTGKDGSYRIEYPVSWEARTAIPRVGNTAVYEPDVLLDGEIQKVTFLEREFGMWQGEFQIKMMNNPRGLSLEQWANEFEVEDIMETSDTTLSGRPARQYSLFGFDHTIVEILSERDGRIYCLTFAGENPNDPDIERHQLIYWRMLSSFTFLPPARER